LWESFVKTVLRGIAHSSTTNYEGALSAHSSVRGVLKATVGAVLNDV
jgi:hypothetical protein